MDLIRIGLSSVMLAREMDSSTGVDEFVLRVRPRLERALVARFGVDDGLEATDEAIAYAVAHWGRLAEMANPAGYLFRVGQSYGSRLRRRSQRRELLVDQPASSSAPIDMDLQRALIKLKPEQRVAVVLVHGHGHSYSEVAEILDVPTTTVANHLNRGLARLRRILESS